MQVLSNIISVAMSHLCIVLLFAGSVMKVSAARLQPLAPRYWRASRATILHEHRRCASLHLQEGRSQVSWIKVADVPDEEPSNDTIVMPIFPLHAMQWPGSEISLKIIDPAYRRMYDDILLSGSRRFLVPWSPCAPGFPRGRVRFREIPEDERRLHSVGVVLYLEDLQELSGETGGAVKYHAKHSVIGRARITRLLNPSALFRTNEEGFKVDYLRAEVDLFDDLVDRVDATLPQGLAAEVFGAWNDLAEAAEEVGQSRLVGGETLRRHIADTKTWQLASLWEQWQLSLYMDREHARVNEALRDWIQEQQRLGKLPGDAPAQIDASQLPKPLLEKLMQVQNPGGLELATVFWEPLLRLQAAEGPKERGELLLDAAREELAAMQARLALRNALGGGPT